MGYEDQNCDGIVGTQCGGMKDLHGVPQVFGGTLPARIFARTLELQREIQASKGITVAGVAPSASPSPPSGPADGSGTIGSTPQPIFSPRTPSTFFEPPLIQPSVTAESPFPRSSSNPNFGPSFAPSPDPSPSPSPSRRPGLLGAPAPPARAP
jgi:hypothetical protein